MSCWRLGTFLAFLQIYTSINATIINKCYYEGDFTVYCNRTKQPLSSDTVDIMRSAKVINGIQFKENVCSYTNLTCHKETFLNECVDKTECHIKNSWFAIPECRGNSYYTHFEYDCQPSYYMCDKTTISNAFSGLILSPAYPHSYKLSSPKPCYLTIHVPSNHYIELTVDYFTLVRTHQCIGDYLNIQEYVDIDKTTMLSGNSNAKKQWKQLSTWCGRKESGFTLVAKSDTISFTFRSFNISTHHLNPDELKYKIYFQAIPANVKLAEEINKNANGNLKPNAIISTNKNQVKEKSTTSVSSSNASGGASLWYFGAGVGVSLVVLLVLAMIVIIFLIRRYRLGNMLNSKKDSSQQNNANNNNAQLNNNVNTKLNNLNAKLIEPDENDHYLSSSQMSTAKLNNNNNLNTSQASKVSKIASSATSSQNAEPRKMQAERSALLKDLSQSKLLNKYKSEFQTAAYASPIVEAKHDIIDSMKNNNAIIEKTPSQSVKTPPSAKPFDYGGIYGAEVPDSSGVYGADPIVPNVEKKKSSDNCSTTSPLHETPKQTESTDVNADESISETNNAEMSTLKTNDAASDYSETTRLIIDDDAKSHPCCEDTTANNSYTTNYDEKSSLLPFNEENQGIVSGMLQSQDIDDEDDDEDDGDRSAIATNHYQSTSGLSTPRKTPFNPLHVILKDKNKYYTTEYI